MKDKRILAFDFGTKRIGVAVNYATLAEPLAVVHNDEHVWEAIGRMITENHPTSLLVGVSEAAMAKKSQEFGAALKERFSLEVIFADETLSSASARQKLAAARAKKKQYQGDVDHFAAAEILQEWLDTTQVDEKA